MYLAKAVATTTPYGEYKLWTGGPQPIDILNILSRQGSVWSQGKPSWMSVFTQGGPPPKQVLTPPPDGIYGTRYTDAEIKEIERMADTANKADQDPRVTDFFILDPSTQGIWGHTGTWEIIDVELFSTTPFNTPNSQIMSDGDALKFFNFQLVIRRLAHHDLYTTKPHCELWGETFDPEKFINGPSGLKTFLKSAALFMAHYIDDNQKRVRETLKIFIDHFREQLDLETILTVDTALEK